uniref:Uncharacterized protein n=1 Tax=Anguilla anguilla TaxID=7936 RepID=A0A0E9V224_ANGAN
MLIKSNLSYSIQFTFQEELGNQKMTWVLPSIMGYCCFKHTT